MGSPVEGTSDSKSPASEKFRAASAAAGDDQSLKICGLPLKYVSLLTLAVQNAMLTVIMHYSRISTPPSRTYSAASAVLLNELLKGAISLAVALARIDNTHLSRSRMENSSLSRKEMPYYKFKWRSMLNSRVVMKRFRLLGNEVFSKDCWKLSIPAILYVIQNNLQYVAASNLQVATFQVTYQMKILTTAAFSVILLRKRLDPTKWFALLALAIGVAIVQLQTSTTNSDNTISTTHADIHNLHPIKGLLAVTAACFTSGLAGVYFEMVLKNSQADLWVRNVQLSLFSLLPALVPILFSSYSSSSYQWNILSPFNLRLFDNFGPWAWATVTTQVFGGLVTAIVIKYSDNILKGFATSLSIIISSVASVALFDFKIQMEFLVGCAIVLGATWVYNRPSSNPLGSGSTSLRHLSIDIDNGCANPSLIFRRWQSLFPSWKKSSTSVSLLPSPVISSRSSCSSDTSSRPSSPTSITSRHSISKLLPNALSIPGLRGSNSNIGISSTSARPLSLLTARKNSYPSSPVIEYVSSYLSSGSGSGLGPASPDLEKDNIKEKEKKRFSYSIGANLSSSALGAALRYSFPSINVALASSSKDKSEDSDTGDNSDQNVLTGQYEAIARKTPSSSSSISRHHQSWNNRSKSNDFLPKIYNESCGSHLRPSSSSSKFSRPPIPSQSQFSQSSLPSSVEVLA